MQKRSGKGRKPSGRKHSGGGKKVFPQFVGKVQMTREGFIFVIVDGQDDDIFVKAAKTRHALQGDTVRVAVTREKFGDTRRREGEVVEIIERSTRPFVGYYHAVGAQAWVLMQSKSMPYDIQVDAEAAAAMGAQAGMKVAAVVDRWDRRDPGPFGHVVDVLGVPGENDTEMHAILAEFNLPYRFSEEVEHAADKISDEITAEDLKGRKDFRDTFTLTIDPADAKDFDDALSFKPLSNGNYEVGVHIADVSYYVRPGSPVDKEARDRGTSVYLVDRTVPMLPEKLCNKLCSLRPHEDKLTFSAVFEITPKAEIRSRWIGRTVINSDFRLDYEQAQSIIEGAVGSGQLPPETSVASAAEVDAAVDAENRSHPRLRKREGPADEVSGRGPAQQDVFSIELPHNEALADAILTLNRLAGILKEEERKKGAIDFDRPEMKVEVDETGKPLRVYQKVSKEANWLIEEFMLLANRTVAEFVATGGQLNGVAQKNAKTFVYRVHGEPNELKLENLYTFAKGFGHRIPTDPGKNARATAKALNELLDSAKGKPEFAAMENLALRAMAKACYSTDNIGHYGLAFKFYTHFTSPIRRYPDLMVHRLLARYLDNGDSAKKDKFEEECRYASERELVAADAERTSIKYKLVEYMMDKIGEEYDGHVSGITEWGMYVEIEPTKIEGMVSVRDITSDFYEFDEARYRLVGKRRHKQFRLGDPVRIRVKSANLEQRLLDFELIENNQ